VETESGVCLAWRDTRLNCAMLHPPRPLRTGARLVGSPELATARAACVVSCGCRRFSACAVSVRRVGACFVIEPGRGSLLP